jgi:protein-S-isoprenylcysteine O-methyltransferase Ste14
MNIELMLRLMVLLLLGCIFLISGFYRRRARTDEFIERNEEGYLALVVRFAVSFPLILIIIMDIFFLELMGWSKINLPFWLRIVGMSLVLGSVLWLWWVFKSIGSNITETVLTKDTHELVTTGPYRWIRHPLYAGALVLLISIGLVLEDYVILGYAVIGILAFRLLVIPVEEGQLLETFGEDYECYQSRTGAILPWFR